MLDTELHFASPELALACVPLLERSFEVGNCISIERLSAPEYASGVRLHFIGHVVRLAGRSMDRNHISTLAQARLAVLRILNPEELAA